MYAAMSESWPGSGIVVSYKKQGFEECLGNVMTFNSLLIIYGLNGELEFTYLNLEIDVHMRYRYVICTYKYAISFGFRIHFIIFNRSSTR